MTGRRSLESLDEEIRDHIEREIQDHIDRGLSPGEARAAALRKFGSVTLAKEDARAVFTPAWFEHLLQDGRYALRMLRRSPTFGAIAILTLALGIGMAVAVFSVFNAVLLRPLGYPHAERLLWVSTYGSEMPPGVELVTSPDFLEWQERATSFDGMVGYDTAEETLSVTDDAIRARIAHVSYDFWALSGTQPVLGRLPGSSERNALLLSYWFFEEWFHGDASVIGRTVRLGARQATVIAVLPKGFSFQFPAMGGPDIQPREVAVYATLVVPPRSSDFAQLLNVVMRLAPHATIDSGRAELDAIRRGPVTGRASAHATQLRVMPLQDRLVGDARVALQVLLGAVGFVLLIACASLANLLLARASSRQKEIAIRAAIGAGTSRLLRQSCVECLVVVLFGWVAGLGVASLLIGMLVRLGPNAVPRLAETTIDGRVIVYSLGAALVAAFLLGLTSTFPVWAGTAPDALKDGSRTSAAPARGVRMRMLLVVIELAVAVVLLAGAGLMLKSVWRLYTYPPGFDPGQVLTMSVDFPGPDFSAPADRRDAQSVRQRMYIETLLHRLQSSPGVAAASITTHGESLLGRVTVEGSQASADENQPPVLINATTPSFARVMGLRLVSGRWIADREPNPVVVLNETLARRLFGHDNPVGRRLDTIGTVTGVVADLRYAKLDESPRPELYVPYSQVPGVYRVNLVILTTGAPLAAIPEVRRIVSATDSTYAPYDVMTLEQALARSILPRRFNLFLLVSFAATALMLALIGIYGVVAYSVAQRTQEIGVRMVLGAHRGDVIRLVIGQAARVTLVGASLGLVGALGLTRQMAGLLYEVRPLDPPTLAIVVIVLVAAALTACLGPALRAAFVNPVVALRHE